MSEGEGAVDARSYASAILNILEDAGAEKALLADTQRAVLNILDDAAGEKVQLEATERAILNILEDAAEEKAHLSDVQRAVLNILDDAEVEKKNAERARSVAEEANRELEAFSYSVAHDLRAPLRSIDGFSLALLEDYEPKLDQDGKRYLKHVRDAAQHMGELIDDLLNLSRVTRAELRREPCDLSALARTICARLRQAEPDRAVELSIEPGILAQADPRLLDVLLTNLFSNAWKFTGRRAPARIEFGVVPESAPRGYFVRDNGAGFDDAYAGKLFGVFQRLHSNKEFEGTGIGLATVQRIARRHGGRAFAHGEVDRGATFTFTLEPEERGR